MEIVSSVKGTAKSKPQSCFRRRSLVYLLTVSGNKGPDSKLCLGIDIIEIARIDRAISRWKENFLQRIYTKAEIATYRNRRSALAARFAAKEATMKTLGTGNRGLRWKEIEILSDDNGSPQIRLYGKAYARAKEQGIDNLRVSLSHTRDYAVASVIGIKNKNNNVTKN